MILITIYGLYTKCLYDGDGRKPPKYTKDETKKKKFPVWLPSHTPIYEVEADCFPVSKKHRKQAGPTLSGWGFLI